jgi:hypothetical protein
VVWALGFFPKPQKPQPPKPLLSTDFNEKAESAIWKRVSASALDAGAGSLLSVDGLIDCS